ncbi:MAG: HemK family protein methyltransferase [Candidatus Paceibacterota bacterium]|nr:HemK family protein methyltransferase [Candidatus Paceibacterota bacterium]
MSTIKKHFKNYKNIKVLDIFSGSGCIGISIAKNIKNTNIDFCDIEKNNLDQIKINLKLNNIQNYQKILKSDIFSKINRKYDLILANPPYVPQSDAIKAPFEPQKTIIAGKDGLSIIRPFISQIKRFLNKNGVFIMEFHPNQVKSIKAMLIKHSFKDFEFYKDQYKR